MRFIDGHCHIDFPDFDHDRAQLIEDCFAKGVERFVVPSVSSCAWDNLISLARLHSSIYPCLGLHPYFLEKHIEDDLLRLEAILRDSPEVIAVGEIGLDMSKGELERQKFFLDAQLEIASRVSLPVVLHSRKTHSHLLQMLRRHNFREGGVLHGFSGSEQEAVQFIQQGLLIGVGGVITYERANKTRKAISRLPLTSLLLETDSPDMPISGMQGLRNTPLNIPKIFESLCLLRDESPEAIVEQLWDNACTVYGMNESREN